MPAPPKCGLSVILIVHVMFKLNNVEWVNKKAAANVVKHTLTAVFYGY